MKNTVASFKAACGKRKLSMLTAYDYTIAKLVDQSGVDAILVGDSLGMVMLGYRDTLSVTMDDMIVHCASVSRAVEKSLLVCDMPFMSFQCGIGETLRNAGRLLKEGYAEAVKLEGGVEFVDEIRSLVRASIPVMGHIGLTPQSVNALGGYKVQGKDLAAARKLVDDARAVQDAGAFAIVLECVPAPLAKRITDILEIPTIGIGAGAECDGQVLVWQDMLGLNKNHAPKFVKRFANLGAEIEKAFCAYVAAVADGTFPGKEHCYSMDEEILNHLGE